MAGIVVCGGGVGGLITAALLARHGHEVTVLERDPAPPPSPTAAWDGWERRGVNQFRLPHFVLPRFRAILERELPELVGVLEAAGAHPYRMLGDDPRGVGLTARRPVLEAAVAAFVDGEPNVTVRRGVAVRALTAGTPCATGVPHVSGVETESGERIAAALVVDATGRRSPAARWLADLGCRPMTEEVEDSGFVYYGRHVRSPDGRQLLGGPSNARYGSVSMLLLPGDDGTIGVGIVATSTDTEMRILRNEAAWTAAMRMLPNGEAILECDAISPLVNLARLEDRWRRVVVDGAPVATGIVVVADSWAATNPSLGRGLTLGAMHAVALRDAVATTGLDDPLRLAVDFDEVTQRDFTPWYRSTVWQDRHSLALYEAARTGTPPPDDDPAWRAWRRFTAAVPTTPALVPWIAESLSLRERPEAIVAHDEVRAVLETVADPPPDEGPTRQELVAAVTAAAAAASTPAAPAGSASA